MIEITEKPISVENVVAGTNSSGSGCCVTYVGLIRDNSEGKHVLCVEYQDPEKHASDVLRSIADECKKRWPVECVSICHRIGKLMVGDINLVIAVASPHRYEGFDACRYAIDQFKQKLPTQKRETYTDGSIKDWSA